MYCIFKLFHYKNWRLLIDVLICSALILNIQYNMDSFCICKKIMLH